MKQLHTITLANTTGKDTLARADDVFHYIDSDFENWNTDKKGVKTESMELAVCELTENMTFAQIFPKPEEMAVTQAQIIEFCKNHKDHLQKDWYTFFLFKVGEEFFVARVDVRSGVVLNVRVRRFSGDDVWVAERRHRIVLPQLALKHLDPVTLSPSDSVTLDSRLKNVEQFMRDNFKGFHV